jgi:hypothetical protein
VDAALPVAYTYGTLVHPQYTGISLTTIALVHEDQLFVDGFNNGSLSVDLGLLGLLGAVYEPSNATVNATGNRLLVCTASHSTV